MKKQGKELASAAEASCREKAGITRRAFLKGTAGFVLLCGSGFGLGGILADKFGPVRVGVFSLLLSAPQFLGQILHIK